MIRVEHALWLLGVLIAAFAIRVAADRSRPGRFLASLFWALLAFAFLAGDFVPPSVIGAAVIAMALLVGSGCVNPRTTQATDAGPLSAKPAGQPGNLIFLPVLLIPLLTVAGVLWLPSLKVNGQPVVAANSATIVGLTLACVISLVVALRITRATLPASIVQGQRLLDAIGWAALLPLLLAMLGAVFDRAGVGAVVASLVTGALPVHIRFVAVLAYAGGMALFTMIMGNAFAAFPVMTAGIGLPILVGTHHADPAPLCALGMLSGYCGTLLTPMAANYNLVPAALLELKDPHGVIKAQAPTGIAIFIVNVVLMNLLLFR